MATKLKKRKLSKLEKEEVVSKYNLLVKKIAYRYSKKCSDPIEDLIQVGLIALLESASNYDKNRKNQFKTYAVHYISGHIRHYIRDKQSLLRSPRSLQEMSYKVNNSTRALRQKLEREPSVSEISKELNTTSDRVDEIKYYQKNISIIWLDQVIPNSENSRKSYKDVLLHTKNDLFEDRIALKIALDKLESKDRKMLKYRYYKDFTQSEIAKVFNVSQMEISRRLKKIETELKLILSKEL